MTVPLLLALSYLFGSLPIGLLIGKLVKGIDVREFGSGNIGASNVWRTLGPLWGIIVFALDVSKGVIPVEAAKHYHYSAWIVVIAGLATIIGHNASVWLKFKGGKGVATSLGVAIGLSWMAAAIGFTVWVLALCVTRYISVSSILATPVAGYLIWCLNGHQPQYGLFGILATVFVIVKHKSNMARLCAGTESRVHFGSNKSAST